MEPKKYYRFHYSARECGLPARVRYRSFIVFQAANDEEAIAEAERMLSRDTEEHKIERAEFYFEE